MSSGIEQKLTARIARYTEIFGHGPRALWVEPAEMQELMDVCGVIGKATQEGPLLVEWDPGSIKFAGLPVYLSRP